MAFGVIYLLIDGTNDKEYVGQTTQTVEERFKEHKRCKTSNIGRAIRKHGAENFSTAILKVCESQEELNCWERHFIKSRGTRWPNGYNNTDGGEGGWERTPESVTKMTRFGMKHSNESKDLIAQSLTGKPGRPLTEEEKAHLSAVIPNKRKVICIETGIIYDSVTEAARHNNLSLQSIHRVCQNKRKTTGGFHWKFADDTETKDKQAVICVETKEIFESLTAAARAHNLKNRTGISNACKNPERTAAGYHWRFVDKPDEATEVKIDTEKKIHGKTTKSRRVTCIDTGEIFESLSEAERVHKILRSSITKACKKIIQTAGGLRWKYTDKTAEENSSTTARHLSDEHRAKLSEKNSTKKPVICIETDKIYESINEAARYLKIRDTHIRRACKEINRTAGGYHWRFVESAQA